MLTNNIFIIMLKTIYVCACWATVRASKAMYKEYIIATFKHFRFGVYPIYLRHNVAWPISEITYTYGVYFISASLL